MIASKPNHAQLGRPSQAESSTDAIGRLPIGLDIIL